MDEIQIVALSRENMSEYSLDHFVRKQNVSWVYLNKRGKYRLEEHPFIDDWTLSRKREKALELISGELVSFGAFLKDEIIGFIGLKRTLYGERMIVDTMHVSAPYRGRGVGRKLFQQAISEAKKCEAKELYISACSSKETIVFYRAMGAELAKKPIAEIAAEYPIDLQMICHIS